MKSLSLSQPHLLIVVGIPGAGKTYFGEKFANTFHAPFINFALFQQAVDQAETAQKLFYTQLKEVLKTRQSVIIDGIGASRAERMEIARQARAAEYAPLFLWIQTDPATAKDRSLRASHNKLSEAAYDKSLRRFTPLASTEQSIVLSGKHTYASQAKVVLKKLTAPRTEKTTLDTPPARPVAEIHGRRSIIIR